MIPGFYGFRALVLKAGGGNWTVIDANGLKVSLNAAGTTDKYPPADIRS
jgi:hypothetical protein